MHKTRLQISSEGTSRVCGRSLTLASRCFLFLSGLDSPNERVLKITVKGIPLSVDDGEIVKMLEQFDLNFTSELKYEHIRHPESKTY